MFHLHLDRLALHIIIEINKDISIDIELAIYLDIVFVKVWLCQMLLHVNLPPSFLCATHFSTNLKWQCNIKVYIYIFFIKTYVVVTSFAGYLPSTFSQCEGKYLYIDLTINTTRRAVLRNRKGGVGKSTYSMFWAFGRIEVALAKSSIFVHISDRQIKTSRKG